MSTKRNHYLSKHYSKAFFSLSEERGIWECSASNPKATRQKSCDRLFSRRRAWGQELEDSLARLEGVVAPFVKSLVDVSYSPLESKSGSYAGAGLLDVVGDDSFIRGFERYCFAQLVLTQIAASDCDSPKREFSANKIIVLEGSSYLFFRPLPIWLVKIKETVSRETPLVLIENLVFVSIDSQRYGLSNPPHINVFVPLTESSFLFWGDFVSLSRFLAVYRDINYLNVIRICQSGLDSRVASSNRRYLEDLIGIVIADPPNNMDAAISFLRGDRFPEYSVIEEENGMSVPLFTIPVHSSWPTI